MAKRRTRKSDQRLARIRDALGEGRPHDALAEARQLLAARVRDAAVLNLAGIAAFQCGETEAAREFLEDAVKRAPKDAEIRMNLGNVLAASDEPGAALEAYAIAADSAPAYAEPAYNAGLLLAGRGRHMEAVGWLRDALDRDPEHAGAAIGHAEARRNAGDLAGARDALEAWIALHPDDPVAYTNLAAVLSGMGEDAAARDAAERAAGIDPGLAAAHFNIGVAQQGLGEHSAAIERYRRTLALEPGHAAASLNMGEAYTALGDDEAAAKAYRRALEIDPGFAKAAVNLADMALAAGDAETALSEIERFLSGTPSHPAALAFKAFALRDLGRNRDALQLDEPSRFIMQRPLPAPADFSDLNAFNAALAGHVLGHPTLTPSPVAHATRQGRHSGELLTEPLGPMDAFRREIEDAFRAYRRRFAGEPAHPFIDACPDDVAISVWGVVMDEDGHQVPHIHPAAWLSGVYYVEVPASIRDDDPDRAGWIEFGRPPDDIHARHDPAVTYFRPEPGLMLLFPSHFYHCTVPLKGKARRISIAFDVIKA
jgi:uncharacterized protein (TIGR02466 family)